MTGPRSAGLVQKVIDESLVVHMPTRSELASWRPLVYPVLKCPPYEEGIFVAWGNTHVPRCRVHLRSENFVEINSLGFMDYFMVLNKVFNGN